MLKPLRSWVNRKLGETRKAKFFQLLHTGEQRSNPLFTTTTTRVRQIFTRAARARWFPPSWHTGEEPTLLSRYTFRSRVRQVFTKTARAKFFQIFHVSPPAPPVDNIFVNLKTRIRQIHTRTARALWFPLYHTGVEFPSFVGLRIFKTRVRQQFTRVARATFFPIFHFVAPVPDVNINVIHFLSRPRLAYARVGVQAARFMPGFMHFSPPAPPAGLSSWMGISIQSATRRGGG